MLKFFTSDLRRNLIKILCLTTGLSIGLVLVARIYFDQTYDTFFKEADRTYQLYQTIDRDGESHRSPTVSGGYAPALKRDLPQVETATRFRVLTDHCPIALEDGRKLMMENIFISDSCLFDVFTGPVSGGNPKDILVTAGQCIVPRSFAEKVGGEVIGTRFTIPEEDDSRKFTIAGIYDDFPLNSTIPHAIFFSMESFPEYADGRNLFSGNDIYHCYVRVAPGTTVEELNATLNDILVKNVDEIFLQQFHISIDAGPITSHYATQNDIRIMDGMFMLLSLILLVGSGLNFLLISIGQIGKRGREMAVRKCYGTSDSRIFGRVMCESIFYLAVSVALAVLVVFSMPDLCSRLLGYTPAQLLTTGNVWWVIVVVCAILLLLTGVIPAWIYCRTPVASAFRSIVRSHRGWKLVLLSVQVFASGVLLCLLVLVARQYMKISDIDRGYDYENVVALDLMNLRRDSRAELESGLRGLSCVTETSSSYGLIGEFCSGNMVWLSSDPANMTIIADNYLVNANFFDMMGMEFIQGETFPAEVDSAVNMVVVEKHFIDVLENLTGERCENIIGKRFMISEHDCECTVCGVVNDVHRGGLYSSDKRAGVWFPSRRTNQVLYLKLTETSPENMAAVQKFVNDFAPDYEIQMMTMSSIIEVRMSPVRDFATSVLIAVIAIIIITFIGLIGYIGDEIERRAKEIAIRKVTGTSAGEIVRLFVRDILVVAVPALIAGMAVALIVGRQWLSQFSEQVSLSPVTMAISMVFLLLIIIAVVVINTVGVASSNPVEHLRNE